MEEELVGWGAVDAPNDGYASEGELDVRKLVSKQNRKNKKSGGFQALGLSKPVIRGILKKGYKQPTPIQRKTIPLILEKKDVVAMARTGSGKTACFLIPLFERLKMHSAQSGARALILSPTRELALQTLRFTKEVGCYTGLRAAVILGGDSIEGQFAALHENPDIIIATPGRLVHICVEMDLKLSSVEYVVFDEADRLFEMGFSDQLKEICSRLDEVRQTVLFSATLPKMLVEFARAGLSDPVLIRLDVESKLSENLRMSFFKTNSDDKLPLLLYLLRNVIKPKDQTLIFAATKHHVEFLHMVLDMLNIPNTYIYSSLDPAARKINVAKFQTRKIRCLIVTDVAARGIDIPMLDTVINYNFPAKPKLFIHRVGRVARAGRSGVAYSFVGSDEGAYLIDLFLFLSETIKIAPQYSESSEELDWDRMFGRVHRSIVDDETEHLQLLLKNSFDLQSQHKVMNNAYKQYLRSRPAASKESARRNKEELFDQNMGYHPLLKIKDMEAEDQRIKMLEALKAIRPKVTVFEMTKSVKNSKSNALIHMQEKRQKDESYINNFNKKIEERKAAKQNQGEKNESQKHISNLEQCTQEDVQSTFSTVIENKKKKKPLKRKSANEEDSVNPQTDEPPKKKKKKKRIREGTGMKKEKENVNYKQDQYFIPYTSKDHYTEQGYSIGTSFEKEANSAALDITQDEDAHMKRSNNQTKWDRKKKKFVGPKDEEKKVKTESGVWIKASYKSGRYKKWIDAERHKAVENENSDGEEVNDDKKGKRYRGIKMIRNKSTKKHPLLKGKEMPKSKRGPKRELKTSEQIDKARKIKAQKQKRLDASKQRKIQKRQGGRK
ncbi:unnamed protein product [Meganyctiphanes norvegica]|uniref:RNA helicase n=1 Tax=Meganyctiphanes norvegica TaxID=48144 RepID=A0AAV2SEV3_MEGNR